MKATTDLSELEGFQEKITQLSDSTTGLNAFFEWASKQIAARFLTRVMKRTPVEQNQTIKFRMAKGRIGTRRIKGGALRRGWTGGRDMSQEAFLNELSVINYGSVYQLTISNNVEYAPYIEYGHKQNVGQFVPYIGEEVNGVRQGAHLKRGAVKGQFMMEKSANEIQLMAPGLSQKLILQYMKKIF